MFHGTKLYSTTLLIAAAFFFAELTYTVPVNAEPILVIVHPNNQITDLSIAQVQNIFFGKIKQFSTGQKATPYTLQQGQPGREEFTQVIMEKTEVEYRAYWARMIFTGRGRPPIELTTEQEVVDLIKKDEHAIGYVTTRQLIDGVKVALELEVP